MHATGGSVPHPLFPPYWDPSLWGLISVYNPSLQRIHDWYELLAVSLFLPILVLWALFLGQSRQVLHTYYSRFASLIFAKQHFGADHFNFDSWPLSKHISHKHSPSRLQSQTPDSIGLKWTCHSTCHSASSWHQRNWLNYRIAPEIHLFCW